MDTNNETPKRRLEDVTPAETIDWSAPGAPAVPLSPAADVRTLSDQHLDWLGDQFVIEADADSDAELRAGGPKRLIAFDYFKRGYLLGRPRHAEAQSIAHPIGHLSPASTESPIAAAHAAALGDAPTYLQRVCEILYGLPIAPTTTQLDGAAKLIARIERATAPHGSAAPTEAAPIAGLPFADLASAAKRFEAQRAAAPVSGGEPLKTYTIAGSQLGVPRGPVSVVLADDYRAAVSASQAAPSEELQKFRHTGGVIYEKLGELKAKVGDTGWWDAVRYRATDTGKEYVTDVERWRCNFTPISDAPVASQAAPVGGDPKCHKCHGNSITHAGFCPLFDQGEARAAVAAATGVATGVAGEQPALRFDDAVQDFLCAHTKLNEDGLDTYVPQIVAMLNRVAVLPAPVEDDAPVEQGQGAAPMYQAQFDGEYGSSVWRDVTEAAYHTFMPHHRRIVYPAPVGAGVVPEGCDRCEGGYIYNTEHTRSIPCHWCTPTAATAHPVAADDQVRDQALAVGAQLAEWAEQAVVDLREWMQTYGDSDATLSIITNIEDAIREVRAIPRTTAHGGAQGEPT